MECCAKLRLVSLLVSSGIIVVKLAYEYGRYTTVRDIYARGWAVVRDSENEQPNNSAEHED
jgi:DNA topoisomerase VI subunit A